SQTLALFRAMAMEGIRWFCQLPNRQVNRSIREWQNRIAPGHCRTPPAPPARLAGGCASPRDKLRPEIRPAGNNQPRAACVAPRLQGATVLPVLVLQALS